VATLARGLAQERLALHEQADALLAKASQEGRTLTTDEQYTFDQITDRLSNIRGHEDRAALHAAEKGALSRSRGRQTESVVARGAEYGETPGESDDVPEVRGLRAGETYSAWSRAKHGGDGGYGSLSIGGFVRAAVLGAKTDAERRALSEGTDSAGGYSVPIDIAARVFDKLRPASTALKAGATLIPLQSPNAKAYRFVKIVADANTVWHAENAAITPADPTFGEVLLSPKSLVTVIKSSYELMADSANIEQAITTSIAGAMAGELDRVVYQGVTASGEPEGLITAAGNTGTMGVAGAVPSAYTEVVNLVRDILTDNGPMPSAIVVHPRTWAEYGLLATGLSGDKTVLPVPPVIESIPWLTSSQISTTETEGASGAVCSSLYAVDGPSILIGMRESLRIEILRERFMADSLSLAIVAWTRVDVKFANADAFGRLRGIK
jgi:HK97 family phage major capsid protein